MKYSIILAGGKGRRLWPVSRQNMPKQFIDLFGTGRTLLQQTFDRMRKIMPAENILVVTKTSFEGIVREQLPELPHENLILEIVNRNTAPATLMAIRKLLSVRGENFDGGEEQNSVVITPADQTILDEQRFGEAIEKGDEYVSGRECVLTMGVNPSRPEPGYGYIQMGDGVDDVHNVKSFTEKPDREFARMFIQSGEFLWNTGIYMANIDYLKSQLEHVLNTADNHDYSRIINMSLDMAIMEKMQNKVVMQCFFGWADIGAWHGIYESLSNDEMDNVLVNANATLMTDDSMHNVVCLPDGKLAVLSGLNGYIVAEKDNVLFICKKQDSSAMVRKMLSRIENESGMEDFI